MFEEKLSKFGPFMYKKYHQWGHDIEDGTAWEDWEHSVECIIIPSVFSLGASFSKNSCCNYRLDISVFTVPGITLVIKGYHFYIGAFNYRK